MAWQFIKLKEKSEDIIQDIFLSIWVNRTTWDPKCNLRIYLNRAVKNQVFNVLRNKKLILDYFPENLTNTIVNEENPLLEYEQEEALKIIRCGIAALPKKCQTIFRLSRENEFSNKEIAELLNISVRTVEKQISIALRKLRRFYDKHKMEE